MTAPRDDDGFTLVELLVSMTILTIIMAAITGSMITFLKNGQYTIERDDHSGGAVVLSTYLNRDLASTDTTPSTAATPCSGTGMSALTLSWTEWTATPADPAPVAGPNTWRASYVVTSDDAAVGGGTRYQLHRRLCKPDGTTEQSLLVRNLRAASPPGALTVTTTSVASAQCPADRITVTLAQYGEDDIAQNYRYSGCLRGRLR